MPSNHLILCHPLLLPPSIFPSIRIFSKGSVLCIRWLKYWSFSISPSSEYSGLISFRMDWFDLLAVHGTLKSSPTLLGWCFFLLNIYCRINVDQNEFEITGNKAIGKLRARMSSENQGKAKVWIDMSQPSVQHFLPVEESPLVDMNTRSQAFSSAQFGLWSFQFHPLSTLFLSLSFRSNFLILWKKKNNQKQNFFF